MLQRSLIVWSDVDVETKVCNAARQCTLTRRNGATRTASTLEGYGLGTTNTQACSVRAISGLVIMCSFAVALHVVRSAAHRRQRVIPLSRASVYTTEYISLLTNSNHQRLTCVHRGRRGGAGNS